MDTRVYRQVRKRCDRYSSRSWPLPQGWEVVGHGRPHCPQHSIFVLAGTVTSMMTLRSMVGAQNCCHTPSLASDHHTSTRIPSPPSDSSLFCCLPSLPSLCVIPLPLPEVSFTYSQFPKSLHVPLLPIIWTSLHPVLSLLPPLAASPRALSMRFEMIPQTTQTSVSQAVALS